MAALAAWHDLGPAARLAERARLEERADLYHARTVPIAALLPFFSTLAGGMAALRLRHRLHAFMALAAGVVVATAVADLLPEAFGLVGLDHALEVGVAAVVGFIAFSFVEAFLHQSSFEHAPGEEHGDGDGRDDRPNGLLAVLPPISLILHSVLDGFAIGLAFQAGGSIGLIVLLAVLAHDFADGMNVVALALGAARGERTATVLLVLDALAPLAGAGLSVLISIPGPVLGLFLASISGVFIAVGAGHLLPEAQHHNRAQGPALVALSAIGAAVVLLVRSVAP
ncbi:MAG TPA: ZIP family metal transporter [Candidatus Limnocylindrales bacterium]